MFFARSAPPGLATTLLLALRPSLNTPVVGTDELPLGPAEAAIALCADEKGAPSLTIVVRSTRSGAVAFYGFEGPLVGDRAVETAIDTALSFGESMGFLFDDDLVTSSETGAERALSRWHHLLGEHAAPAPGRPEEEITEPRVEPSGGAADDEEIHFGIEGEEPAPPPAAELMLEEALDPAPAPRAAPAPPPAKPLALTKFRRAPVDPEPPAAPAKKREEASVLVTKHGPAVGRVKLVKQRRDGDRPQPLGFLLRLLGSF